MLESKSNTLFVGYLDQFHIHAGVSWRTPMGLTLKNTGEFLLRLLKPRSNQKQLFSLHTGGLEIPNGGERRAQGRSSPNRAPSGLRPGLNLYG